MLEVVIEVFMILKRRYAKRIEGLTSGIVVNLLVGMYGHAPIFLVMYTKWWAKADCKILSGGLS